MCCTGSRHNRPTLSHAELMRERKKRGLGSYRKDSDGEAPRCTQCGHDKPIDRWKTCPHCREKVERNRPRKAGRPKGSVTRKRSRGALCTRCGCQEPVPGRKSCARCLEYSRAVYAAEQERLDGARKAA